MTYLSRKLRPQIAAQAHHRCGYCQTQEVVNGVPLMVEHIIPLSKDGADEEEDLWLSCRFCNEAKGIRIMGLTQTGRATIVALDLNNSLRVSSRALWAEAGYHPPAE